MRGILERAVVAAVGLCLSLATPAGAQDLPTVSPNPGLAERYAIGAGNVLRLILPSTGSQYSGDYVVEEDGSVYLPEIGALPVEGMLVPALRRTLREQYGRITGTPDVVVTVLPYFTVTVLGEVATDGNYLLAAGATPLTAVAAAGGFTGDADQGAIYILRGTEEVRLQRVAEVEGLQDSERANAVVTALSAAVLQSGDAVIVPRRKGSWLSTTNLLSVAQLLVGVATLIKLF